MSKKKLVRRKLPVRKKASVKSVSPSKKLEVLVDSGGPIELSWIASMPNALELVSELNIYVRGKRRGRGTVNTILPYFRYVVKHEIPVNRESIKRYRAYLDRKEGMGSNTKSQKFGATISFIKCAMAAGVLAEEQLPENFRQGKKKPKKSFSDLCRAHVSALASNNEESETPSNMRSLRKKKEASLTFATSSMDLIRGYAESRVRQTISDWEYVFSLTGKISEKKLAKLKETDFRKSKNKTVDLAFSILFAHFGFVIPKTADWPPGICDWCRKKQGWLGSRVSAAFFPNIKSLDAFLVLMLSEDSLALNVDSAAMYSYIDCCKPSSQDKFVDVHFGKYRGEALNATLRQDSSVVEALNALSLKLKRTLPFMPGGKKILSSENVPLFTYWPASCGRERKVRGLDPSTTSDMVRRCIREAARSHPGLLPLVGKATGENFRPTHALIKLLNDVPTGRIQRDLNQKNISTTKGYVNRVEAQALLKNKQESFQLFIIEQVEAERRTGSGYLCSKDAADGCVSHSECYDCDAKRIYFKSPEIVAEWIAMEKYISENEAKFIVNNPERWVNFWQFKLEDYRCLLALTDEKMKLEAVPLVDKVVLPWLS